MSHPFVKHARRRLAWSAAVFLSLVVTSASAKDLAAGDPAPEFALQGSDGKVHRLSDYRGRTVVLAWFPKAFTGG